MNILGNRIRQFAAGDPVACICLLMACLQCYVLFYPDPLLMVQPDSIGYLGPAVDAMERGYFSHWYARGFVYPLFLWGVLSVSPEPYAIVLAQRLLVMLTYLCLAGIVWLLAKDALRRGLVSRFAVSLLAAFWLLAYVLYPPVVEQAQAVMAETLFSCMLMMVFLGVVAIFASPDRLRLSVWLVPFVVFLSCMAVLVKPHWLPGAALLPVSLLGLAASSQRWKVAKGVAAGLVLSVILGGVPEAMLQQKYDSYLSKMFGPRTLFCNNAELIRDYLKAEHADAFSVQVEEALSRILSPEERQRGGWPIQGFNGDRCMYGETGKLLSEHFSKNATEENAYYLSTYLGAVAKSPGYVAARLTNQFEALTKRPYAQIKTGFVVNFRVVSENRATRVFYADWLDKYKWDLVGFIESPLANYSCELKTLYRIAGWMLVLMSFVALVRSVAWKGSRSTRTVTERVFLLVGLCAVSMNALIALVHTFDIFRYAEMQASMFSVIGFAASVLALRPRGTEGKMLGIEIVEDHGRN